MLATILFRIVCFPISSLRTYRLKYTRLILLQLYECGTWSLTVREMRVFETGC